MHSTRGIEPPIMMRMMISTRSFRPASMSVCQFQSWRWNPTSRSTRPLPPRPPMSQSTRPTPIADKEIPQPAEPADAGTPSHCEPDAISENPELPNEPTDLASPHHNPKLPNEPTASTRPHHNPKLPNEPTATTRPYQGDVRKQIESGSHRREWRKKPKDGPHSRERKAQSEKRRMSDEDLSFLYPSRDLLTWQPPS